MPIYEYECEKCGNKFEIIQKMSDKPLKKHENCGGKLTKLISAAGFQFKGTGWYVTDYARKSSGDGNESTKTSKENSSNGGSEKSQKTEKSETDAKPKASGKKETKSAKE
jgi:putative FmdB family regulatory protein